MINNTRQTQQRTMRQGIPPRKQAGGTVYSRRRQANVDEMEDLRRTTQSYAVPRRAATRAPQTAAPDIHYPVRRSAPQYNRPPVDQQQTYVMAPSYADEEQYGEPADDTLLYEEEEDVNAAYLTPARQPNSSRYVPQRRVRQDLVTEQRSAPRRFRAHWTLKLGIALLGMLIIWTLVQFFINVGTNAYNQITFGTPRTFQIDEVVHQDNDGPNDPSHFIALNLHGKIQVTEYPAGDPSKGITYPVIILYSPGASDIPVTLQFKVLTASGLPDMIVTVNGQQYIYINDPKLGKFRALAPTDQIIHPLSN